jgi:HD-GYP domain-containing protein (c-di-GMP phosphodiesterase class II)/DNA-binding CsgD family transcriptional regulator
MLRSSEARRGMLSDRVRLADLLAAVSVATDLGMGQEPEKAIRACLVATALARQMGTPEAEVCDVYYTALLRHLGCTATAHEEAWLGGDELASRPAAERADFGNPREALGLLLLMGRGAGVDRVRYLARSLRAGKEGDQAILTAVCEVGARLAERLHLGAGVRDGLYQAFERWDGKGTPQGQATEGICLPARLAEVGHQVVIFDRLGGPEAALAMVRRRSGGWFDPGAAEAFARFGTGILEEIGSRDVWEAVLEAEPAPQRTIGTEGLDGLARALADMVDLKSPYLLGHSSEVAVLSERVAVALGFDPEVVADLRRAALLHDLGRVAVSNAIWEKPAALSTTERERVRLHPYQTERILARSRVLAPLARTAGMHHERQDGSGYHRGAAGAQVPAAARVLAAADAFQAMTRDRPHRPGLAPEAASAALVEEARLGRLDPECVRAVVEAAGQPAPKVRTGWPASLSDREVEVLRLVARGLSNRAIAERLYISPRTAEHHVQHLYTKIGASTRAAAAMFAMEHGLLRD